MEAWFLLAVALFVASGFALALEAVAWRRRAKRAMKRYRKSVRRNTRLTDEIIRLRRECFDAYQAVGNLCLPDSEAVVKLMDNLAAAADGGPRPHDDLLPAWQTDLARPAVTPERCP